jgi:CRP/FNR family transcriptional regulator, cyclic AMP receptor protein
MESDSSNPRSSSAETECSVKQAILRRSPLASLTGASRDALLELGRVERLPRRHRIMEQGDAPKSLLLLGAGRVKLERTTGDRVFPLGHRGPGQLVGEMALAGAVAASESAAVLDDVEALSIPLGGVRKLLAADAALRAVVTAALVHELRAVEDRLASLLLHGVEARLVGFLLEAALRWGAPQSSGELILAPFTHADVALLIGSTRETVTLLFGKLKRADLIAFDRRRVLIRDRDALARHAATA